MKDPKILPFGSWFKVYEQAGRNFKKSQQILEARSYSGIARLYEGTRGNTWLKTDVTKVDPGNLTPDLYDGTSGIGISNNENNAAFEAIAQKVFGKEAIPNLKARYGGWISRDINTGGGDFKSSLNNRLADFLKFYLSGIEKSLGDTSLTDAILSEEGFDILNQLELKSEADGEFDMIGSGPGVVDSYSSIDTNGTVTAKNTASGVFFNRLIGYLNTFNLTNFAVGDNTQYVDPTKLQDENKIVTLASKGAVQKDATALYLFTDRKSEVKAGQKDVDVNIVAAEPGKDVPFRINYKSGEFSVDANGKSINVSHPDIIALANSIIGSLNNQAIDKMTLTSSASPEWNGRTTSGSGGSENPSPKLNDTTYKSDKTDAGNKYLAWRRGTYLVQLLKGMLPNVLGEIDNAWMIGEEGAEGRNCKYVITQLGKPGKTKITTNFTGAKTTQSGQGQLKIFRYKVTFNESNLTKSKDTLLKKFTGGLLGTSLVQYADVKEGQEVLYYGTFTDSNGTFVHVSHDYSGPNKIQTKEGVERPIKKGGKVNGKSWKDNLVKGKAKKTVADNGKKLVVDFVKDGKTEERYITKDRFYSAGQDIAEIGGE
jgi:hypothetical protein